MKKNKAVRFLDNQNVSICLRLSSIYYRKLENGKTTFYILHPRFWLLIIARKLIILFQLLLLNKQFFQHLFETAKNPKTGKLDLSNLFLALTGVKHFVMPEYTPAFYLTKVPALLFPPTINPTVTIVIPVFNQISFTLNCLRSVYLNLPKSIEVEIVVVDDASTDDTSNTISSISGITYIHNEKNIGFLKSCNKAMKATKGSFICLLNNDTIVQPGWLDNLLEVFRNDEQTGCAGSKLIYPYGLLQEAGGVIFDDGSGANYGKYGYAAQPKCNFKRQVDYCSGACILFKKTDAEALGYFDEQFTPAYYEDTDFCFAITHILKKKVFYVPTSVVVHFEGISSGKRAKKGNIKSYQVTNKEKFFKKWLSFLKPGNLKNVDASARRFLSNKQILVVDDILPAYDQDSGSTRMFWLIKVFISLNYHVIFVPRKGGVIDPYYSKLLSMGVEVIQNYSGKQRRKDDLLNILKDVSYAWICRPRSNQHFKQIIQRYPRLCWLYDTVDLHYIRQQREASLLPNGYAKWRLLEKASRYKKMETSISKIADVTLAITPIESEELKKNGAKKVCIVPNIHEPSKTLGKSFLERAGVTFIGNFTHTPNRDAVLWLVTEIMPLVWQRFREIKVYIVGANITPEIKAMANENIILTGHVPTVDDYFNGSRIFVAPLRYGAGMKGKIGQAMEFGLPTVSTVIGTEGMGLTDEINILEANTTEEFANQIMRLYNDEDLWTKIAANSEEALKPFSFEVQKDNIEKILNESCPRK